MKLLNRSAFSLLPKQAFVDWVNALPEDEQEPRPVLSLAEHRQEGSVYLIDEVDDENAFNTALGQMWRTMFENELTAWDEFGDYWPEPLTQELFQQWFELQPQLMTFDLASSALMTAKLEG